MPPVRLLLPALRLDREPREVVSRRAAEAIGLGVGGFILFGGEADAVARLVAELRRAAERPLWIAADLERGAGQQFHGLPSYPPPAALAAHPEPQTAVRAAAAGTARDARAVGVNLVLAPVLDLDVEPANPIVGTRSFGASAETVAGLCMEWIRACQEEGVAACAKHFPGHGRTRRDSHLGLPVVEADAAELEADLLPFRRVASHVACVMTAHVAYPALGAQGPATFEPAIVDGLLRRDLGFNGLVLTDALEMGGARLPPSGTFAGAGDVAGGPVVAALLAGCDLLVYPPDVAAAAGELERAAELSPAVADRVEESVARSEQLLDRFGGPAPSPVAPVEMEPGEAERIAERCVAVVGGPLPSWLAPGTPLNVATVWDDREGKGGESFGEAFRAALRTAGWRVSAPPSVDPVAARVVLIASTPQAWKGTASLTATGRAAAEGALSGERTFPIVFGHRRVLEGLGRPGLCAWSTEPLMERAAARALDALARERDAGA